MSDNNYISAAQAVTLDGLFRLRVDKTPDKVAYTHFDRAEKAWVSLTWSEIGQLVARWQAAFRQTNMIRGDRVAILLRNCPDWVAIDQASMGNGYVVVPLYTEDRPDNIAYVVQDAGAKVLVVQDSHHWKRLVETAPDALKGVQHVVVLFGEPETPELPEDSETRIWSVTDWLPDDATALAERESNPDELATIVYTSGTTGKPKGVMLSHRNILSIAEASGTAMDVSPFQKLLSFLPLSHTFERTCGYYTPMMFGMEIAYARSTQQLADDLLQIKPDVLISVPRIFERVYDRLQAQLGKSSAIKRLLFNMTVNIGWKNFQVQQQRKWRSPSLLLWPLLRKKVAQQVLEKFGGNLKLAVSGGAALPPPVAKVFLGLGLNVIQGYGMTESSPVVSANRPDANDPQSVGSPLKGVDVRISDNDELQVYSPGIMLGYWNNHKATREVITSDGWLRTGDKARIDHDFIYITGRIKDILIMSNGEKIPPVDMEDAITLDPIFDHALIVGEGKPFLGAFVVLNAEHWVSLAKQHQLDPFDQSVLNNSKLHKTLLRQIAQDLRDFPGYAKVRRIYASLDPWTVENGLLTPTLKTKRQKVMELYKREIETIYAG